MQNYAVELRGKGLDYYMNTAIFLPIPITVLGGLKDLPKIKILLSY